MHVHRDARPVRFGPFQLDPHRRVLTHEGIPVELKDRQLDVLVVLVSRAGELVTKEALTAAVWPDVAVTDNSLAQAVARLRRALGMQSDGAPYIETRVGRGYRFVAPLATDDVPRIDSPLDALMDPHRAFYEGRAALERLECAGAHQARDAFASVVRVHPDDAAAHTGLANALALAYEATRADSAPDHVGLARADQHARTAVRLAPDSAEAWSTFAFVQHRRGATGDALAAARRAVTLEPDYWRHHLRVASVSWGEDRLHAARAALRLNPDLALAHWFVATVCVARQQMDRALAAVQAGCDAQDAQRRAGSRYGAVGLHLLHGLLLAAADDVAAAHAALAHELTFDAPDHVYARECAANTWYAIGALHLRDGAEAEARAAFDQAIARVPGHPLATMARGGEPTTGGAADGASVAFGAAGTRALDAASLGVDAAIALGASLVRRGCHAAAARLCGEALVHAEPGQGGWILPVEPLLHVSARRETWASALATLRARAL